MPFNYSPSDMPQDALRFLEQEGVEAHPFRIFQKRLGSGDENGIRTAGLKATAHLPTKLFLCSAQKGREQELPI
jgi:hypothetical protein